MSFYPLQAVTECGEMCSNTYLVCLHLSKGFLETDAAGVNRCCNPVFSGKYFYLESLLILIILWQVMCLDRFISNILEDHVNSITVSFWQNVVLS